MSDRSGGGSLVAGSRTNVVHNEHVDEELAQLVGSRADWIPAYCASKAGLLGLTRSMAAQLGPDGIRVNAVYPGFIVTPMIQPALDVPERPNRVRAGRATGTDGPAPRVANVVAFLLSDKASFVTGTEVVVDGGLICTH